MRLDNGAVMKRSWIEYQSQYTRSPMSFWIHRRPSRKSGPIVAWYEYDRDEYTPPLPRPVAGRGFAVFHVELDGFVFRFSSFDEMKRLIDIFSRQKLPTTYEAQREEGDDLSEGIRNQHWLSRLPAKVLSSRYRQRAVNYLRESMTEFAGEIGLSIA